MRAAVLLAFLTVGNTCAGGNPEMRTIANASYAEVEQSEALAVFDAETYRRTWSEKVGRGEAPHVDFAKEAVVFLFAGTMPTGGYVIEPKGVRLEDKTLVIEAPVKGPPAGGMVTMALSAPYVVMAVSPREFKDVRWNEAPKTRTR